MVIAPGYAHPYYQAMYSIARTKGIPTAMVLDGYPFFIDKYLFQDDWKGQSFNLTHLGCMGDDVKDLYRKAFNKKSYVELNIRPPLYEMYNNNKIDIDKKNEVMVLFPYGMIQSVHCRWDQRFKYVIDVIDVLCKSGVKNVIIKMKETILMSMQSSECDLLQELINENYNHNTIHVKIVYGKLYT